MVELQPPPPIGAYRLLGLLYLSKIFYRAGFREKFILDNLNYRFIIISNILLNMSREKFLKAYANLPSPERVQILALIDDKPYSWDRAYDEISNDTELGRRILKKLEDIGIL